MATLLYQGHGSYRITTDEGKVIYVDPFAGKGYEVPADLVLITHEHSDHNQVQLINFNDGGMIIREKDVIRPKGQYLSYDLFGVKITGTPAMNENHDPRICCGFLLEFDGKKVYCAGDTSTTDYMKYVLPGLHLDLALLPCDGIYNMGPEEAAKCADIIQAKMTIPIHSKPGALYGEEITSRFDAKSKLLLKPGETLKI
jgi:L-ascorbate metabolism protein UlaG (beta-lactamase superfamily)